MPVSLRTITWSFCIRTMDRDSTTVIIMGSPSGTATITTLRARVAAWSSSSSRAGRWDSSARISEGKKLLSITNRWKRSATATRAAAP